MSNKEDKVTLRDIYTQLQNWIKYLLSRWILILVVAAVGAVVGFIYAYLSKPTYTASVSFVLSSNSSSSNGILGLASQFGIDLNSGSDDVFAGDNIIALMKSRAMVQEALMNKPAGNSETLLNIFVKDLKLDEAWNKNARTTGLFPFPDDRSKMNLIQDSLFREVYDVIQKKYLDISKPDKDQNVYVATTTTANEIFSYHFIKDLVSVTSAFYISTKTSVAKKNLDMLQHEADSLRSLLGLAIISAASQTDVTFNLNPAFQVKRSGAQESQVQASALGDAYGEVLKNLEIAKITLQKETPLYQIIDSPILPLKSERPSKLLMLIIGGCVVGFVIVLFLIMRLEIQKSVADISQGL